MKRYFFTTLVLQAFISHALAWPFQRYPASPEMETAAMSARLVQLDSDPEWEVYSGGRKYLNLTVNGEHSTVNLLPGLRPIGDGSVFTDVLPGRGDAGDIDGDGDIDIVYSLEFDYDPFSFRDRDISGISQLMQVVVCVNDGSGSWTRKWEITEGDVRSLGAPDIRLADMDRDGDLDMVETHGAVKIRWNDGSGNFSNGFPFGTPLVLGSATASTSTVQVDDFDGNGWPDVLMINPTGTITLASQDSSGFTTSLVHPALEAGSRWRHSIKAELNGDNHPDLLITTTGSLAPRTLYWLRNTGSGFTGAMPLAQHDYHHSSLTRFQTGDLDEDGTTDIVYMRNMHELMWRRGLGGGTYAAEAVLSYIGEYRIPIHHGFMGVADVNRDGSNDVFWDYGSFGNSAPLRQPQATIAQWSGTALTGTTDLTIGDLNTDGRPDLIALDGGAKLIRWYASGAAGLTTGIPLSISSSTAPLQVAAGDWNRDGWTDLAWCGDGLLRQALSTAGTGLGWTQSTAATLTAISAIQAYDMDVDGDTDILSASAGGVFRTFRNNGSGSAWTAENILVGSTDGSRIAAGQWVRGGRAEAATLRLASGTTPSRLRVFNYDSPLSPLLQEEKGPDPASAALLFAELDPANHGEELVYANGTNQVRSPYFANAIATMSEPVVQLAAADWDANGSNDILVAVSRSIVLLYRQHDAAPWLSKVLHTISAAPSFRDLVVLDINDDGLPDAAATDSSGVIHLLTNTSAPVKVTVSAHAGSTGTGIVPGGSSRAITVLASLASYFRHFAPIDIAPVSLRMRFRRSTPVGGADAPGTILTAAEAQALVDSVWLQKGSTASAPVVPSVAADGTFTLSLSPTARVPLADDAASNIQLHVKLKSTAAAAAVQRFYVEVAPTASSWVAMDNDDLSGPRLLSQFTEQTENAFALLYVRPTGPLDTWRFTNFGTYDATGSAANDADPDGDRIPNLVEYVTSQNPNSATGIGSGPAVSVSFDAGADAMVTELRLLTSYDSKVKLTLQYTHNPAAGWSQLSTRTGTGAWTASPPYATTTLSGGRTRFTFNGGFNPSTFRKTFFRLKAEELP